MKENRDIEKSGEHGKILSGIPKINNFEVPSHYFDTLPGEILARINSEKVLARTPENPFEVPAGYFEALPDAILKKCMVAGEVNETVLAGLPKNNPFEVPEGYFAQLPLQISDRITRPRYSWFPEFEVQKVLRPALAIAAMLIVAVGVTLWQTGDKNSGGYLAAVDKALSKQINPEEVHITEEDLINAGIISPLGEQVLIDEVDPSSLEAPLENSKAIEDFLIENNANIEALINEI